MSIDPDIQLRIAEDIALLHILGDVPSAPPPSDTSFQRGDLHSGHELTLEQEKEFVSDMAFLSSIEDDISNITAVAVQELAGGSLRILVAANSTPKGPDAVYLGQVKRGFDELGNLMRRASMSEFGTLSFLFKGNV
jgi:hypothetical protein